MRKTVCVITGGGSGMGLTAAKEMPRNKIIALSGRTMKKLEKAVSKLTAPGHEAHAFACDTSRQEDVRALAAYAASLGEIRNVIHAACLSPAVARPEQLLRVNALGTVHVNRYVAKDQENDAWLYKRYHLSEKADLPKKLREAPRQEQRAALRITLTLGVLALFFCGTGLYVILMVDSIPTYPLGLTLGIAGICGLISLPATYKKAKERLRWQTEKNARTGYTDKA